MKGEREMEREGKWRNGEREREYGERERDGERGRVRGGRDEEEQRDRGERDRARPRPLRIGLESCIVIGFLGCTA